MTKHAGMIMVAVVVGGVLLAVLAYYIARFMKGTMKLALSRTTFNPGDIITGRFDLHTKKEIEGNKLIVSLIGVQITKHYENGKHRTHSREVYRDEVLVEGPKVYPAETTAVYDFKIAAPNMQSPEFMNSTVGQALTVAFSLLGNRSARMQWKIEARLDAQGVDLATSQAITINSNQLL
jgi:hypothetical protein